ncbi:MAG TPA: EAL domain-containing protein, partial [Thermoanaerobaculia bacterium]|nr:EAL domain-containing protein [Thermoanaerobaculia bacterium]
MPEESRPPFSWVNVPTTEPPRSEAARGLLRALCDPDRLETVFQPVFRARTGELEGCEALLRVPAGSGFAGPGEAFGAALAEGLGGDLEAAAIQRALRDAEPFAGDRLVFLNLLATSLSDPRLGARWLVERAVAHGRVPAQLILELGQISRVLGLPPLARALEPYRAEGLPIAIDDFGAGYTNLRMITDLAPDFVKLDSVFVKDVFVHARKRILVESVVSLCHRINCGVIAEGIETPDDLETCLGAGVDLLQGFLLARPGAPEEAFVAEDLTVGAVGGHGRGEIAAAVSHGPTLAVEAPLTAADDLFRREPELDVVPVLQHGRAVGLLARNRAETFRFVSSGSGGDTVAAAIADAP